jgi:hypothetical protein
MLQISDIITDFNIKHLADFLIFIEPHINVISLTLYDSLYYSGDSYASHLELLHRLLQ